MVKHRFYGYINDHVKTVRGSGMTTGLALGAIAAAVLNPGADVHVRDPQAAELVHLNQYFASVIRGHARALGLKGITVCPSRDSDGLECIVRSEPTGRQASQWVTR